MWGKVPLFEATLPFYYPSTYANHKSSIFSNRSKNDTDFKQQLNDIRQMGMNLTDSNRRIGHQIFLNAQMEGRQRFYDDLQPMKRSYEPIRQPNNYILSNISSVSSNSSYSVRPRSFDLPQDSYYDTSSSSGSSYNWSFDVFGQSFTNYTSDTASSQKSEVSLSNSLDDESSFDFFGSSPSNDVLVLTDMLNNIFGDDDTIYPTRSKKSASISTPTTSEGRSFESTVLYGVQFNVNAPSLANKDYENSFSKTAEDPKCSRKPSEPVKVDKARKQHRRESIDSADNLACTHSKRTNGCNVVEKIIDSVITDVENSREQLKWN